MSVKRSLKRTNNCMDYDTDIKDSQENIGKKQRFDTSNTYYNNTDIANIDIKLNAIYLLLNNIGKNIEKNNNDVLNMKTDISSLYLEIKQIKKINDNVECMQTIVERMKNSISTIEDNLIQTNMFNEEMIIDNIKKLSLKIDDGKINSKTIDYSSSYIN